MNKKKSLIFRIDFSIIIRYFYLIDMRARNKERERGGKGGKRKKTDAMSKKYQNFY